MSRPLLQGMGPIPRTDRDGRRRGRAGGHDAIRHVRGGHLYGSADVSPKCSPGMGPEGSGVADRHGSTTHWLIVPEPLERSLPANRRMFWVVIGLVVGFAAGTVLGAIVLVAGDYDPSVAAGVGTDIGRTAMQLISRVEFDDRRIPIGLIALLQLPLWIGLLGAPVMAAREGMAWRRDLRWSMKAVDVPMGIASGLALQLVLVPLLYVPIFWLFGEQDVEEAARSLVGRADGGFDVMALVMVTVIGAPVVEEIFFRGLLYGALG